jgi:Tol biopolymer transport system component
MNADGSAKRSLTEDSAAKPHENRSDRVWTPAAIFFIGSTALRNERPSGFHLFRIRPDGSGLTDLTPGDEQIHSFELSPDRRTIAFATFRGGLFVMGPDGTELRRLTEDGVSARDPTWSPTNGVIAFTGLRGENEEIYAVRVDASGLRNLTRNRASDNSAGWRPALR